MTRYIDADKLIERHCEGCSNSIREDCKKDPNCATLLWVVEEPTADVVGVVRCKDCRFNVSNMKTDKYDITDYSGEDIVCSYFMTDGMLPDDFCSYGKLRKGRIQND